jgi:hypothetical protein
LILLLTISLVRRAQPIQWLMLSSLRTIPGTHCSCQSDQCYNRTMVITTGDLPKREVVLTPEQTRKLEEKINESNQETNSEPNSSD